MCLDITLVDADGNVVEHVHGGLRLDDFRAPRTPKYDAYAVAGPTPTKLLAASARAGPLHLSE